MSLVAVLNEVVRLNQVLDERNEQNQALREALKENMPYLHRLTRRVAPGYRDDGLTGYHELHASQAHEAGGEVEVMGGKFKVVCVGCELERRLALDNG